MPPQKRAGGKPENTVRVDPPSAAQPRPGPTTPSKKAVAAAVEKSAKHLEEQSQPPTDVHPGPTTPSKAEVEEAVEQSAEHLEEQSQPPADSHPRPTTPSAAEVEAAVEQSVQHLEEQGVAVTTDTSIAPTAGAAAQPVAAGRDAVRDAAPVSAGGRNPGLDSAPVSGARDKRMDAKPVFTVPPPTAPTD